MIPHIIHNPENTERAERLAYELKRQGIKTYIRHDPVYGVAPVTGCSRAHKNIIRWAIQNDVDEINVWEDDICFPAADGFQYYLSKMPAKFDIYFGGINCPYKIDDDGRITQFCGTHCMIIRRPFYNTILAANENQNIDLWLHRKGLYYVCYPFAAIQYNGHSEIMGHYRSWDDSLKDRKIYGLNC